MRRLLFLTLTLSLILAGNVLANDETQILLQQSYEQTKAGQYDEALSTLQRAVAQDPDSSLVHTRIGGVRVLRKEYSAGIKDFQRAIMLDQSNASAFVGMALAYLHMGQYSLARASLDEAAKIDPSKQSEIDRVLSWIDQRTDTSNRKVH